MNRGGARAARGQRLPRRRRQPAPNILYDRAAWRRGARGRCRCRDHEGVAQVEGRSPLDGIGLEKAISCPYLLRGRSRFHAAAEGGLHPPASAIPQGVSTRSRASKWPRRVPTHAIEERPRSALSSAGDAEPCPPASSTTSRRTRRSARPHGIELSPLSSTAVRRSDVSPLGGRGLGRGLLAGGRAYRSCPGRRHRARGGGDAAAPGIVLGCRA